jgi:hypothetical protein
MTWLRKARKLKLQVWNSIGKPKGQEDEEKRKSLFPQTIGKNRFFKTRARKIAQNTIFSRNMVDGTGFEPAASAMRDELSLLNFCFSN